MLNLDTLSNDVEVLTKLIVPGSFWYVIKASLVQVLRKEAGDIVYYEVIYPHSAIYARSVLSFLDNYTNLTEEEAGLFLLDII